MEHRRLEHREQGRRHGQRTHDRFHRAPRAPRRPASQHGRRDGREPIGVGGGIRLQHARGIDGNFSFFQNLYVSGYVAGTSTPTIDSDQTSYRGNLTYGADRYGFSLDRMVVDRSFNPEIGFVPRLNVRRNFASARFSPAPARIRSVRRFIYEGGYNYETDDANRLESREVQADFRIERQNSDVLSVEAFRNYELLRKPLLLAPSIRVPAGSYGFSHVRSALSLGQQHRLSGVAAVDAGEFYDGTKQTFTLNARYGFTRQLGVEPNVSLNWVERGRRVRPHPGDRCAHDFHGDASDVRVGAHPVRLVHALAVHELPLPLGISTWQRTLCGLHGWARHDGSARRAEPAEPWHRDQGESPLQDVTERRTAGSPAPSHSVLALRVGVQASTNSRVSLRVGVLGFDWRERQRPLHRNSLRPIAHLVVAGLIFEAPRHDKRLARRGALPHRRGQRQRDALMDAERLVEHLHALPDRVDKRCGPRKDGATAFQSGESFIVSAIEMYPLCPGA